MEVTMKESLDLETTPCNESCVQVGCENYSRLARQEALRYIALLEKKFPKSVGMYRIKSNPHDFGTYLSLEIVFDDENEEQSEIAYEVEANLPENWED